MPSSGRHVLDIKKKGPSRAHARGSMGQLFQSPRQKPKRLKDQRRATRILVTCACAFSALVVVGALSVVSHLDQLAIRDISVTGAQAIPTDALSASAAAAIQDDGFRLFSRENMFLYPRAAIEKTLAAEFPRIKDVSLSRPSMLAQAVVVAVEERAPFAKWCGEVCYLIDSTGFVFAEEAGEETAVPYVFRGGLAKTNPNGQWFLRGRLAGMVSLLDQLGKDGFPAEGLTVDSEKDFSIRLKNGTILLLSFDTDPQQHITNLKTALEDAALRARLDELEYIDLRFGNRVYFK